MSKRIVVTGGSGFIGSYLVKKLVKIGHDVVVIDSMLRGSDQRLLDVKDHIQIFNIDIRDTNLLKNAIKGADVVMHLAAVNGTENFYKFPELVLDIGLRGILSVVDACREVGVYDLVVASSAEVYQTPNIVPTPESIPLTLPDSLNPRYSYGGSKIISELIAFNYGKDFFRKVQVFRPHNVYGPDMGWKHVIPQFVMRAAQLKNKNDNLFLIQGDGSETRAFCYVDDIVDGIIRMYELGSSREIYHIGNNEEITIRDLALTVGRIFGLDLALQSIQLMEGGTLKRCPDISKMKQLGYLPTVSLNRGLELTVNWYMENQSSPLKNELM